MLQQGDFRDGCPQGTGEGGCDGCEHEGVSPEGQEAGMGVLQGLGEEGFKCGLQCGSWGSRIQC